MQIYYFLPVVLIAAAFAYSFYMKRQVANMSPEEAAQRFHDHYSAYFDLKDGERVVGAWSGLEFQGAKSATRQLAGAALNSASAAVIGVSTYVPLLQIGLTSTGRVLVAREYSELGQRGNYAQVATFDSGARAVDGATALPGENLGSVPKNPFNPAVSLEFVQLRGGGGESYEAWMSPQGAQMGHPGFRSIVQALGGQP